MPIQIPQPDYLTFAALQQRWACKPDEIRCLVVRGVLKPAIKIDAALTLPAWEVNALDVMEPIGYLQDEDDAPLKIKPCGWHYLQEPSQIAAHNCIFKLISDDRDADIPAEEGDIGSSTWYRLDTPLEMGAVESSAVFLMKEIIRFEENHPRSSDATVNVEKPLGSRERDTLLKLVIGMAIDGYGYEPAKPKSSFPKELQDALMSHEIAVSDDTIRKYLKEAKESVLPAKQRQS